MIRLLLWCLLLLTTSASAAGTNAMSHTIENTNLTDFDFLVGQWQVHHRKLRHRLAGDDQWVEFSGSTQFNTMLSGAANIDVNTLEDPAGTYQAITFRLYSPESRTWSIWWVDGRHLALDPPVHGKFEGNVGLFYGDDTFAGQPIKVRFIWNRLDLDHARWEQAFSADGGSTWETNWVMDFTRVVDTRQWCGGPTALGCKFVELRQYTLHSGKTDALIELFEDQFIESQEAAGMAVLGQFRDLDASNRFVWLRGFGDMASRLNALTAFYSGPTWRTYRDRANDTMIDSDNVLLLQPAWPGSEMGHRITDRPPPGSKKESHGIVDVTVFPLSQPAPPELLDFCKRKMQPALLKHGAVSVAWYVTAQVPNNFPRLPIRDDGPALVGIAVFPSQQHLASVVTDDEWQREISPKLSQWLASAPQTLRLAPTSRSALRYHNDRENE